MSRSNGEDQKLYDPILEMGTKFGVLKQAIAGATMTLDRDSPTMVCLDPAQALVLTLPAVERGLFFWLNHVSTGNFDITISSPVNRAGAAGATTMATLSQNEMALAMSDGVTWYAGVMKQT